MGRTRTFDEATVVARAGALFARNGYEATSIDDLVVLTGLHRGSLYKAFGSKRGLFLLGLRACLDEQVPAAVAIATRPGAAEPDLDRLATADVLDLVLVAAVELAPHDDEVRVEVARLEDLLGRHQGNGISDRTGLALGRRLSVRAGLARVLNDD